MNVSQQSKIIKTKNLNDYEILTDSGWEDITHIHKTKKYKKYIILTEDGKFLECADNHIVFDDNYNQVFVKNLKVDDSIITSDGLEKIIKIEKTNKLENMYDVTVDSENHRYYTNNILSHNTNCGKTAIMCHLACSAMKSGYNVLYCTAEMSESMIGKRIDANLLDINCNDLNKNLDKKTYLSKIKQVLASTQGKIVIKEYPTGTANSLHIKNLLKEIKSKRNIKIDILFLDYLNIFASHRLNSNAALNSYQYIKTVTEEMRAISVEFDLALVTATQTNRSGAEKTTDLGMESISDSFGTAMTMDWMCGIIQTPELFDQRKYLLKNIKSRFDSNINQVVTIGVDYGKMRLLNLDDSQQEIPLHIKDKLAKHQKDEDDRNFETDFDFS